MTGASARRSEDSAGRCFSASRWSLSVSTAASLDIRQRARFCVLVPLEHLAAADRPLELANELLEVVLHDPVEVDQLAIDVVDYLAGRRHRTQEIECRAATEQLDVALMRRK